MIQRIQSIWLFLAAICNAVLFFVDLYQAHSVQNGINTTVAVNVMNHYPSLILALVGTLAPLIAIFLYKKRKQQRSLTLVGIVATIGFLVMILTRVSNLKDLVPSPTNGSYTLFSVLPIIAIILQILAWKDIKRDEKLIKSLDRLR